ncbi:MAG: hypothetical protein HY527_10785 [Betaproteobacteria bacterium]|nr:hypothetical protein [Betaproteobacteria bacterium]
MCHLILALPLLALPVFWLLPLGAALPLYGAILALTAAVFVLAVIAMRKPVRTGAEALLHAIGTVRAANGGKLMVWVKSELWSAETGDSAIAVGDAVEVLAIDALQLRVRSLAKAGAAPPPPAEANRLFHSKGERR